MTGKPPPARHGSRDEAFARARADHEAGRFDAAEESYRDLLVAVPGHPDALHLLGVLCSQTGRHEDALGLIRQSIHAMPNDAGYHHDLGNVFMQLKQWEDAAASFRQALELERGYAEAAFSLGLALTQQGKLGTAVEAFRRAIAANPRHANAMAELSGCLGRTGATAEAIALVERALGLQPDSASFWSQLGTLRIRQHDWDLAVEAFDAALGREPWHVPALAGKGTALFEAGRDDEARRLVDLDGLIFTSELELPSHVAPDTLAEAVAAHHSRVWQRVDKTTRGGAQTANLLDDPDPAIKDFISALDSRVRAFVGSRVADPSHPFCARIPYRWTYSIWATILFQGGHQDPHLHPAGWLSGVFYLEVPDRILAADNTSQAGWIEFGAPGYGIAPVRPPAVRRIRPEFGKLVLFPSYFFHRTLPLDADARRISIAFDVVPTAWRAKLP